MKLTIIDIAHHRNGICGAPFTAVLFEDSGPEISRKVGIVFEEAYHCAVLDVSKLAAGDIAFSSNSWRGDQYEPHLRKAITASQPTEPSEMDIDEILAQRRQIAIVWSIEDVQEVRPDLNNDQAWEVLQAAKDSLQADIGITPSVLECHAEMLIGYAPDPQAAEEE